MGALPRPDRGTPGSSGSSARPAPSSASARSRSATTPASADGAAEPARQRQGASSACASGWSTPTSTSGCTCPVSIRAAPTSTSPARSCSTRSCAASAPRTSRCAISRCAKGWCSTTSTATRARIRKVERYPDVRRRSVVELGERCGYWSEHAQQVAQLALSIFDQTRSVHGLGDREREWLEYARAAARRRRAHQLRAPSPPFVLPDQEWRSARLRAAGDRGHRARRALPSSGDAEEVARGLRRPERDAARDGPVLSAMVRLAEGLDRSHAQALAGDRSASRAARITSRGCARAATRSWSSGPRIATSRRSSASWKPRSASRCRAPSTRNNHRMLNNLTTPHEYPGKLFVVEGIDGSGKTTQLALLAKWLSAAGHPRLRDRVELVGAGQGGDQDGQEEERADADDVQPAARDRFRRPAALQHHSAAQGGHDRARRPLRLHRVRARCRARRRSAVGARAVQLCGQAGHGGVFPRADRSLGRSAARPPGEAEVLRGRARHGLELERRSRASACSRARCSTSTIAWSRSSA